MYRACSVIGKEPTIPSKKTTRQKEANTEHPSSVARGLLQHGHSFSVQCLASREKTFIRTNNVIAFGTGGNQKFVYHTENGLNCVQRNIPWRPQGSGSSSLGDETEEEEMRLSIPRVVFQVLQTENSLTSWLDTYKETSKPFSFPLSWPAHSCYCLQPAQDPAGTHFSSESDHWQIATLDISAATTL